MEFSSLIGAAGAQEFAAAFHAGRAIVRPEAGAGTAFAALWSEWELEALCRFTPAPHYPEFRFISQNRQVPTSAYLDRMGAFREEAFRQLRAAGASVALGNWENYSNHALALSRAFEAEFDCPVQVNLYVTPAGHQGLGSHVDPHDVLVLQVRGEKAWDVYRGAEASSGCETVGLRQGGWLFLPKGMRHEVRNRGHEMSVHFTVGFHPLTWGEIFSHALAQARIAAPEFNARLPVGVTEGESRDAMLARLAALLPQVNVAAQAARYYADFPALGVRVPADAVAPRAALEAATDDTRFAWAPAATLAPARVAGLELHLPYRRFALTLRAEFGDTVKQMRERGTFAPRDLPLPGGASSLLLCRLLASNGALAWV